MEGSIDNDNEYLNQILPTIEDTHAASLNSLKEMSESCNDMMQILQRLNIVENRQFTEDSIVNSVIEKFIERSRVGQQKYGVTLDRMDLSPADWVNHALEEAMDFVLYLTKLKREIAAGAAEK